VDGARAAPLPSSSRTIQLLNGSSSFAMAARRWARAGRVALAKADRGSVHEDGY
jgi:hypothetical protein